MNSVILFDIEKMLIVVAYKVKYRIIGFSVNEARNEVHLITNQSLNVIKLKVHFPST